MAVLKKDRRVKAAVIGGGLTGILTAYLLQECGMEVIVLEAEEALSGQSSNYMGRAAVQQGLQYAMLLKRYPKEQVRGFAQLQMESVLEYLRLLTILLPESAARITDTCLYTTINKGLLEEEQRAAVYCGLRTKLETNDKFVFPTEGILRFQDQAVVHPLSLLEAAAKSVELYEHTPVSSVEGYKIYTDMATIQAEYIVFASARTIEKIKGCYPVRLKKTHNTFLALSKAEYFDEMYCGIDLAGSYQIRSAGELLLFGGNAGQSEEILKQKSADFWPGSEIVAGFQVPSFHTPDHMPYIGTFSKSIPEWYLAAGFGSWGNILPMTAAILLVRMIREKETGQKRTEDGRNLVDPGRNIWRNASKTLLSSEIKKYQNMNKM